MPLAVIRLRTARAGTWRTSREQAAGCLTAPWAQLMARYGPATSAAGRVAVRAIGDDVASWVQGLRLDDTRHVVQLASPTSRLLGSGGAWRWRLCHTENVGTSVRDLEPAQS